MNVPAISYRATVNDYYDFGFYELPNRVSHQCFDFERLRETLQRILAGELGGSDGDAMIDHYLAARSGPMACERIIAVLEEIMSGRSRLSEPTLKDRLRGTSEPENADWKSSSSLIPQYLSAIPAGLSSPPLSGNAFSLCSRTGFAVQGGAWGQLRVEGGTGCG